MCNTAPLLRIDFQAIKRRERSDRRRRPDIAKQLKEIKWRNAAQATRGCRVSSVEIPNRVSGVSQVGNGFPCAICVGPTLPMHQVFQTLAPVARVHNALHFVFLFANLRDVGGTGSSHRLARETLTTGWMRIERGRRSSTALVPTSFVME